MGLQFVRGMILPTQAVTNDKTGPSEGVIFYISLSWRITLKISPDLSFVTAQGCWLLSGHGCPLGSVHS